MSRRRSLWVYTLAGVTVVWLSVGLVFSFALLREHGQADCKIMDSTYGERHWQWNPPGTYCTVSGNAAGGLPASASPLGWHRPPDSRTVLVEVLIATGAVIVIGWFLWFLRWLRLRD